MPTMDDSLPTDIKRKLRLYHRLLLSYGDFKQARYTATYIIDEKLHDMQDFRLLESLNCAMIIAYTRPFSGNDRNTRNKIPDLPRSFLSDLTNEEKEIHEAVMLDRNTLLAHSDSEAAELEPTVLLIKDIKIVAPYQKYRRTPLTQEATETFMILANKMFEKVVYKTMEMEPELLGYFPHEQYPPPR